MALSPRLDLRQTQSLVMTPQLQQAIKLLALSNLEIETFVAEALESNPLLEMVEHSVMSGSQQMLSSSDDVGSSANERFVGLLNEYHEHNIRYAECGPETPYKSISNQPTTLAHFGIHHYAGTVIYDAADFAETNSAGLRSASALGGNKALWSLLANSGNSFVRNLYAGDRALVSAAAGLAPGRGGGEGDRGD